MRFSEIQHQARALSILRRGLQSGRVPHAYLFEGPAGVGKEMTGRALGAKLLCEAGDLAADADPCGVCDGCRMMAADVHPDYHLVHRGLHHKHPEQSVRRSTGLYLVVDVVRHFLIEPAGMKPAQGRCRVFVVRDAERMNEGAQNSLLKTLEEPPGSACLILVTSHGTRLRETIRSRCQRVPFDALPGEFVAERLVELGGLAVEQAKALAVLSGGRLGVALHWARVDLLATAAALVDLFGVLKRREVTVFGKGLVGVAEDLGQRMWADVEAGEPREEAEAEGDEEEPADETPTDVKRDALKLVLMLLAGFYRDALIVQAEASSPRLLPGFEGEVRRLAGACDFERLDGCLGAIHEAERFLDRNVQPKLVGERLAVGLLGELRVGA